MGNPRIEQRDEQVGFYWVSPDGRPATLATLVAVDDEPERLPPTHLSALDDSLIEMAGRFGEVLGGGRAPAVGAESVQLRELHRVLDRLIHEYAESAGVLGLTPDVRAGQIVGTAALFGIRARMALGSAAPGPFSGQLDDPSVGVVAGRGQFRYVNESQLWRGGRWVVAAETGELFPLTLSMLLFDSSGVNKDAALEEHRAALSAVVIAAADAESDPYLTEGAIDWMLYDWLMAHRESPESAAIEIRKDRVQEAAMIVQAADASARTRARVDTRLFDI